MAILDFANIDMDILFPVVCMKDYDDDRQDLYYKRLLRSTLFPLAVLLALILLYQYQKWHLVNSKLASNKRGQKIRDLRSTIFYVSLFFSFVVFFLSFFLSTFSFFYIITLSCLCSLFL